MQKKSKNMNNFVLITVFKIIKHVLLILYKGNY